MRAEPDTVAILAQANFFRGLSLPSRRALAEIALPRFVPRGEWLFHEDEAGHSIYLVARGRVELSRAGPDAAPVVVSVVPPGQVFAEIVLFEKDRYPVSARTLTDCHLYSFARRDIRGLLAGAGFRNDFLAMLFAKQRHLTGQILRASSGTLEARLFAFLREQYGDARVLRVDLSKRDVAAAIRTTPESLSRLLRRLAERGLLTWSGRAVRIGGAGEPPRPETGGEAGRPR